MWPKYIELNSQGIKKYILKTTASIAIREIQIKTMS